VGFLVLAKIFEILGMRKCGRTASSILIVES